MYLSEDVEDSIRILPRVRYLLSANGRFTAAKEALDIVLRMDYSIEQRMYDDALEINSLLKDAEIHSMLT